MGRTSAKSAKKGRISDLTYDSIQEEKIRISCMREGRNVEYALECEPDYDIEREVINATLDDQAADLDGTSLTSHSSLSMRPLKLYLSSVNQADRHCS